MMYQNMIMSSADVFTACLKIQEYAGHFPGKESLSLKRENAPLRNSIFSNYPSGKIISPVYNSRAVEIRHLSFSANSPTEFCEKRPDFLVYAPETEGIFC